MIRSEMLAEEARSTYTSGKEFVYDHVHLEKTIPFQRGSDTRLNIKVNAQRRSMKAILLLFMEPYSAGVRDSEKYVLPRPDQSPSHNQWLAQHALQRRHRQHRPLGGGQPLFRERKKLKKST